MVKINEWPREKICKIEFKKIVLPHSAGKLVAHRFQIELEFSVDFCVGRQTGEPGEKPLDQGENQTEAPLGFEPRPASQSKRIYFLVVNNNYVIWDLFSPQARLLHLM